MCTAITYQTKHHYFGRNLDLEYSYHETVTITPRNCPFVFRHLPTMTRHHAMIGMAYVRDGYPLYYDATNEKGLSMAGLNFPGNACYKPEEHGKDNVASFELIPWILGQCATRAEAQALLDRINLTASDFSPELPPSPLHWMISDRRGSLVVEPMKDGLHIYDDPTGVLTNNPPFPAQMVHLSHYMALSPEEPENHFSAALSLQPYSRGMGAMGLPGDLSSPSRFVRAAFARLNSCSGDSEPESLSQFFHILDCVAQIRGCVRLKDGRHEITRYSSCCNTDTGVYYYTTYENRQITGVDLHREDLDRNRLVSYPLIEGQQIQIQNDRQT